MKRIILILSAAVLLVSCKISKQATTDVRTEIEEKTTTDVRQTTLDSSATVVEMAEDEHVLITVFSVPDSAGKQHIVSVTEINRNKQVSGKKNHVLQREVVLQAESIKQTVESVKITENTKIKPKVWECVCMVAALLILSFVLSYFVRNRYI
ncbi:MAG: hypothetical protein FWC10_06730 [Lentimicrobiaceae bacterium]|nr:hypothetical protein [Lentimicrobiaceae bacterium]MCL2246790.1 hypothetical protein [Lentimicrobiaceae bacterium]